MVRENLPFVKSLENEKTQAPPILLEKAAFLLHLGVPRAALVLYDWACQCAPEDPAAVQGQVTARRIAVDAETTRYWKQIVGSRIAG
ncbi:MAG: hypothetical protein RBG13Loki_3741 [Promethearchaeota archaeon CR_4]|nr:MAG: hypothetical protein RBG13Loki_3741 [Candidatus Lokiarchaeota archaeon CR_4]